MTRDLRTSVVGAVMAALLTSTTAFGQTPPPAGTAQTQPARGQRGARPGGRAGLPPITANMTPQQLQAHIDAYALVQAERELVLTNEQFPNFAGRLRRLQEVKRRHTMERRRLMGEMRALVQGNAPGRDEAILEHLRALDDVSDRTAVELRKAYQDMDAVLSPWQRGRFRLFEEQLERLKIELLAKIAGGA
jgi:hypothetical protein